MFGKNEIIGRRFFKDADNKLFVTSLFMTLQGEGPYRGEPAFFVRFAKCNLACSFCDTYFDNGDWYTLEELNKKIDIEIINYFKDNVPDWVKFTPDNKRKMVLVVTGGEPMLQNNIVPFLEEMNQLFENTQIESNGTQWQEIPDETTLVVSPKCREVDGKPVGYLNPHPKVLERADCLKFVMNSDTNSPYSTIPGWAHEWRKSTGKQVFISPMNIYNDEPLRAKQLRSEKNSTTIEERSSIDEVISFWETGLLNMTENQKNHEHAAQYCIKHGLTFNLQQHLFASAP